MNAKAISAFLADCEPDELINYRMEGSMAVFVGPDGKKYRLTAEQLGKGEIAMQQTQTLEDAAKAPASEAHAPKRRPKQPTTKRKTTTKRKPTTKRKTTTKKVPKS